MPHSFGLCLSAAFALYLSTLVGPSSRTPSDQDLSRLRAFAEPLVPTNLETDAGENTSLARAISAYADRARGDDTSALEEFLVVRPRSRWALALLTNLGITYRQTGYWAKALDALKQAWSVGRHQEEPRARALADRAFVELAELECGLGLIDEARPLFAEVADRPLAGAAQQKAEFLKTALLRMESDPGGTLICGPLAVWKLLERTRPQPDQVAVVMNARARAEGTSLTELLHLANRAGLRMRMAFRSPGAPLVAPAVMNLKVRHFVALVEERDGRYLVEDPSFSNTLALSREALDAESSGYFLIPDAPLPPGWHDVDEIEGATVWGK